MEDHHGEILIVIEFGIDMCIKKGVIMESEGIACFRKQIVILITSAVILMTLKYLDLFIDSFDKKILAFYSQHSTTSTLFKSLKFRNLVTVST